MKVEKLLYRKDLGKHVRRVFVFVVLTHGLVPPASQLTKFKESPEVVAQHLGPHPWVGTRCPPARESVNTPSPGPVVGRVLQQAKEGVEASPG